MGEAATQLEAVVSRAKEAKKSHDTRHKKACAAKIYMAAQREREKNTFDNQVHYARAAVELNAEMQRAETEHAEAEEVYAKTTERATRAHPGIKRDPTRVCSKES